MDEWVKGLLLVLGGAGGGGGVAGFLKLLDWWRAGKRQDAKQTAAADRTAYQRLSVLCDKQQRQIDEQADLIRRLQQHVTEAEVRYAGLYAWGEGAVGWMRAAAEQLGDGFAAVPDLPPKHDPGGQLAREEFDRRQVRTGTALLKEVDTKVVRPEKGNEDSADRR